MSSYLCLALKWVFFRAPEAKAFTRKLALNAVEAAASPGRSAEWLRPESSQHPWASWRCFEVRLLTLCVMLKHDVPTFWYCGIIRSASMNHGETGYSHSLEPRKQKGVLQVSRTANALQCIAA